MSGFRDDLARFIREADADNELSPYELATQIVGFLRGSGAVSDEGLENAIEDFAHEANRGAGYRHPKPMGAAALAAAIADEFHLDEER